MIRRYIKMCHYIISWKWNLFDLLFNIHKLLIKLSFIFHDDDDNNDDLAGRSSGSEKRRFWPDDFWISRISPVLLLPCYNISYFKEKFLKSVILFLKYIKYKYLYIRIPILFARTISIQIYIINIFLKKVWRI